MWPALGLNGWSRRSIIGFLIRNLRFLLSRIGAQTRRLQTFKRHAFARFAGIDRNHIADRDFD